MNLLEMAFTVDWFLTIPGILITCGVVLLIVALIMFIFSSVKGKKKVEVPSILNEEKDAKEEIAEEIKTVVTEVIDTPVINNEPEVSTMTDEEKLDEVIPEFVDVNNTMESVKEEVVEEKIVEEPIIETVEESPVVDIEMPSFQVVEEPALVDVQPEVVEPIINQDEVIPDDVIGFDAPVVEEVPTDNIIIPVEQEVEHRPIYGGADPLESTQKINLEEISREPYGGHFVHQEEIPSYNNEVVEEPVNDEIIIQQSVEEPIEESIPEVPEIPSEPVEFTIPEIPVVEEEPEVKEVPNVLEPEIIEQPEIVRIPDNIEEL